MSNPGLTNRKPIMRAFEQSCERNDRQMDFNIANDENGTAYYTSAQTSEHFRWFMRGWLAQAGEQ